MAKFGFNQSFDMDPRMERQALISKYNAARINLLAVVAFTVFNIITLAVGNGSYFLFSANMPYMLTFLGMFICGMLPDDYYEGLDGMFYLDKSVFVIFLILSIIILALYVLCWYFSKNGKVKWLKTALILFSIDTVVMLITGDLTAILFDIIFHIWVIYILVSGIKAHKKIKAMTKEDEMIEGDFTELPVEGDGDVNPQPEAIVAPDSTPLRPADTEVKARILLEAQISNHTVTYRRVKRTNELVIDGNVYDEYVALAELPHMLTARIGGHNFSAGTDNTSHSFIKMDGETVKTKIRLV